MFILDIFVNKHIAETWNLSKNLTLFIIYQNDIYIYIYISGKVCL